MWKLSQLMKNTSLSFSFVFRTPTSHDAFHEFIHLLVFFAGKLMNSLFENLQVLAKLLIFPSWFSTEWDTLVSSSKWIMTVKNTDVLISWSSLKGKGRLWNLSKIRFLCCCLVQGVGHITRKSRRFSKSLLALTKKQGGRIIFRDLDGECICQY